MAARISLRVKSGCLATRVKSHSECSSSGEVLPPLGLASTLPVSLRRRHHRITELTPTSNTSATSRRDAPLSTASTARSRKSVEYGFGIDLAPRRINFSRFARAKAVGNPPDSMPPGNALAVTSDKAPAPLLTWVKGFWLHLLTTASGISDITATQCPQPVEADISPKRRMLLLTQCMVRPCGA